MNEPVRATAAEEYTRRLELLRSVWWKRWLHVQATYRWNLRSLELGGTLRQGVGVDHNEHSVAAAQRHGCVALVDREFHRSAHARPGAFDSLLLAHVLEPMSLLEGSELVG